MKPLSHFFIGVIALGALAGHALAAGHEHAKHQKQGALAESSLAYAEINEAMHMNMSVDYVGDADIDFVRGMIPHHQGAVDMCKVQLTYGKDPEILELCRNIIEAQEAEIAFMQDWLAKREQ